MANESRFSVDGSTDSVPDNSNDNSIDTTDAKKMKEMESRSTVLEHFEKIFENDKLQTWLRSEGGIMALLEMVRCRHPDLLSQDGRGIENFVKCKSRVLTQEVYARDMISGGAFWELIRISRDCSQDDIRPRRDPDLLVDEWLISILPRPPHARVWSNGLCHNTEATHLLYFFRDQLDLLMEHQSRTLHQIYRTTLSVQDSDNNELCEFEDRLSKLALNFFRVAGERGRGCIEDQYPRGDEYVEPRPQPRRRECVTHQYLPRTPYQPTEFTDSDFYGHSPIIPDPNPQKMPPIDSVPFILDLESQVDGNGIELESHFDDNGENTLGVSSRRGGRPCGRPPGRSRFQNAPAIRRTRPDEINGGKLAHPHMPRPRANIHTRGCGTH
ncbi:hypothetical protein BC332_25309 [Capsicum chinense]|nr:hypothetical protein BC332_25309 [Capsicum chinense]